MILLIGAGYAASAQSMGSSYGTALGIKAWGDGGGISIKSFIGGNQALEGIGYFWDRGSRVVGLYEFHSDFSGDPGLKWYVGPGAHIGFYNNNFYDNRYPDGNGSGSFVVHTTDKRRPACAGLLHARGSWITSWLLQRPCRPCPRRLERRRRSSAQRPRWRRQP